MKTKFYVDGNGNYLGGFAGAEPPEGAIEVPTAPNNANDKWVDGVWVSGISIEQHRTNALTSIDQAHAEFLLKSVGNPTQVEINTWPLKLEIKNALLAGLALNLEQQAFLDSAGLDTPAKQNAWAQSVQAKSAYSAHATGVAEAVRDTAKQMVQAAQNAEELAEVMQELTALAEQKLAEVLALKG